MLQAFEKPFKWHRLSQGFGTSVAWYSDHDKERVTKGITSVLHNQIKEKNKAILYKSHNNKYKDGEQKPLDYDALILCLRKMNHIFKGKRIGLPQIGCGLARGNWAIVKELIINELKDCNVTVVIYNK
jgi:hypothetical protein